jgi:hypothetical protein
MGHELAPTSHPSSTITGSSETILLPTNHSHPIYQPFHLPIILDTQQGRTYVVLSTVLREEASTAPPHNQPNIIGEKDLRAIATVRCF